MPKSSHPRKRQYEQAEPPAPRNDWLERLASFNLHFGRFVRDAAGVILIAFALMSLLAVWSFTDGSLQISRQQGVLLTPVCKHSPPGLAGEVSSFFLGSDILDILSCDAMAEKSTGDESLPSNSLLS